MSSALARARARFEATPRSLDDDELTRIARGDRGCSSDLLSFLGAAALVASVILGAMGTISFAWTYVAMGLWIGGFAWGTVAQARSGKSRKLALESGPLVLAVVLRDEPWLRRPGKRAGRAVVVFTTDLERRFDRDWLERVGKHIEAQLDGSAGTPEWVPLRALLVDRDAFATCRVPPDLLEPEDRERPVWLSTVAVHPERLVGSYLGAEDDREAGELDLELDAPSRPPTLIAIVDPEHHFIEQVPQAVRVQ